MDNKKDVVPELLEKIKKDFIERLNKSKKSQELLEKINNNKATFKDGYKYAELVGEKLAESFKASLSSDVLPDGRMYYNIADRILNETLGENHKLISRAATQIQTNLNKTAGIGIKGIQPKLNQDRINGLIKKISKEKVFDDIAWLLDEPVKNFSMAVVDDTIAQNAGFQYSSGLRAKIVRHSMAGCCKWCDEVAGTYYYPDVPKDIYRRHQYCRCQIDYYPGKGRKKQDVWSKKWVDINQEEKIEERKKIFPKKNK